MLHADIQSYFHVHNQTIFVYAHIQGNWAIYLGTCDSWFNSYSHLGAEVIKLMHVMAIKTCMNACASFKTMCVTGKTIILAKLKTWSKSQSYFHLRPCLFAEDNTQGKNNSTRKMLVEHNGWYVSFTQLPRKKSTEIYWGAGKILTSIYWLASKEVIAPCFMSVQGTHYLMRCGRKMRVHPFDLIFLSCWQLRPDHLSHAFLYIQLHSSHPFLSPA